MLAARTVLRGVDAIAWGSASPAAATLEAVDIGGQRVPAAELTDDERRLAEEALCDAWEMACWAPEIRKAA